MKVCKIHTREEAIYYSELTTLTIIYLPTFFLFVFSSHCFLLVKYLGVIKNNISK